MVEGELEDKTSRTLTSKNIMKIQRTHVMTIVVAILSTALSYIINCYATLGPINNYQRAGPVFAASTVGIIAALLFKNYAVTGYIGAFVGMCSITLRIIPSIEYTLLFGFICGVVCILFAPKFVGYGGKAGTAAFLSVTVTTYILMVASALGLSKTTNLEDYFKNLTLLQETGIMDYPFIIAAILSGVFGTMATILLREKVLQKTNLKMNEVVLGPAIIGLISAILVQWTPPTKVPTNLQAIIASGTYAGMASRKILPTYTHYLITGLIVGIVNVTTATVFMGFGGGLGFRALISIVISRVAMDIYKK